MEYALNIQHLTKEFKGFTLDDVTLALPGGTILGLIGENGAGKSTLIKCVLGILHPTSGTVSMVEKVGYVPDECPFPDALKISAVASFLAGIYGPRWDADLFGRFLDKFGLSQDSSGRAEDGFGRFLTNPERKVKELSRGMKMKLTIAAALAHRPQLLILDEATSGLDPVIRDEILDVFLDFVSDDDHAILISSHITSDLEKLCDYVAYIHKGRLTVQGPKDELLAQYGRISCTKDQLSAIPSRILVGSRQGEFGVQALVNDRAELVRKLPQITVEPATLEDIMIYTTRAERSERA